MFLICARSRGGFCGIYAEFRTLRAARRFARRHRFPLSVDRVEIMRKDPGRFFPEPME